MQTITTIGLDIGILQARQVLIEFIGGDGGGKDVFVHISAAEKAGFSGLAQGAKVSYEIIADRGKEAAGNLRIG